MIRQIQIDPSPNKGFSSTACVAYHALVLNKNYRELHFFLHRFIATINCPQVSDRFIFSMGIFLFSGSLDPLLLRRYAVELMQSPVSLCTSRLMTEFNELLQKIRISTAFQESNRDILGDLSQVYMRMEEEMPARLKVLSEKEINRALSKYNLIGFLTTCVPAFAKETLSILV
jgi:hypothetical protein